MSAVSQVFVRFLFLTFWQPLYSGRPAGHVRYFCSRDSLCTQSAIAYILKSMALTHGGDFILFGSRLPMLPYLEWPAPSNPVLTRKHFKEDHQKNKIHKKKIYKEHKIIEIRIFSFLFFDVRHNASLSRWRGLLSTNGFSVCRARRKISFLDSHRHRSFTVHGGAEFSWAWEGS